MTEQEMRTIVAEAGAQWVGIQGTGTGKESLALFNDQHGSTLSVPISQLTIESVKARLAKSESLSHSGGHIAANEPWEMTLEEFGYVSVFPTGNRFNIRGEAQRIRVKEEGISRYFSSIKSAQDWIDKKHKDIVKKALGEGKPVPPEVLADYPELKPPHKGRHVNA